MVKPFFLVLLLAMMLKTALAASAPVYQTWLLTVDFNSEASDNIGLFLQDEPGELWCSGKTLSEYGFINLDQHTPVTYQGQIYYRLHDFQGLTYQFDKNQLTLTIIAPPALLKKQTLEADQFIPSTVLPPNRGGYFNYDTSAQTAPGANQVGGLFTAGFFNQYGVGTTNFLLQNQLGMPMQYVRLNTTWQDDFPDKMRSLRLGDTYTAPSLWGQSVGFGGIQWGTNFSTQPNFVTFPLPSISGASVIPSSVNLLVNNTPVANQKVNSGPFNITNIPVITGAGTVSAVTTDFLGRQQIVSVPYYANANLLKKGLTDFSYEAGFVRNNYGSSSNDYSQLMVAATHAKGLTSYFTEQSHVELLAKQQTAGIGGGYTLSTLGVLSGALALSHANSAGTGGLATLGFQRQSETGLSLGSNLQLSTPAFVELGYEPYTYPSVQSQSYVGYPIVNGGTATLAYTLQQNRSSSNASLVSAAYSQSLPWRWSLTLTALTNVGGGGAQNQAVFMTLSRAIGTDTSLNVGGNLQADASQGSLQLTKNLPDGPGYGYNILAAPGQTSNYQAGLSAQNNVGTYNILVANQNNQNGLRGEASGSIVALSGAGVYLSRQITSSFAVVETGIPNMNIYNFNQVVGKTNKNGNALIPDLIPYQNNPIGIDLSKIPMNAEIGAVKLNVIPYYNSGRLVKFPIKIVRSAVVQIVLPDGKYLPAGASVHVAEQPDVFPVADEGELYISGLQIHNKLIANWDGQQCQFDLDDPITKAVMPDLGKMVCLPVTKLSPPVLPLPMASKL